MLTHQPLFVGGIEDLHLARSNAWAGMAVYIAAFTTAMVFVVVDSCKTPEQRMTQTRRRSGNEYEGVSTGSGPAIMQEYAMSLDLPRSVSEGMFS